MSRIWMPLYIGDYLGDTRHLSPAEHGCYLLLLMHCWQNGSIPLDDAKLARICGARQEDWTRRYRDNVLAFFSRATHGYEHPRVARELARVSEISNKRKAAALQKHSNCSANAGAKGDAKGGVITITDTKKERKRARKCALPPDWKPELKDGEGREWEKFKSYHLSKGSLFVSWDAAWRTWKLKAVDFGTLKPEQPSSATILPITGFHAHEGTPEMAAWDQHWKLTRGVLAPRSRRVDGAIFSTRWPPGHPGHETPAKPLAEAGGRSIGTAGHA